MSTILGCPIEGPTKLEDAVSFPKRFLEIGADDIESMILDAIPDTSKHVVHFHVMHGWGLANVLAALQAGIVRSEKHPRRNRRASRVETFVG